MVRTQIYLPSRQHDRLKAVAMKRHVSVSEVIREIVDEKLSAPSEPKRPTYGNAGDWLLDQAKWAEEQRLNGPSDLAARHDAYIYDDKK